MSHETMRHNKLIRIGTPNGKLCGERKGALRKCTSIKVKGI